MTDLRRSVRRWSPGVLPAPETRIDARFEDNPRVDERREGVGLEGRCSIASYALTSLRTAAKLRELLEPFLKP